MGRATRSPAPGTEPERPERPGRSERTRARDFGDALVEASATRDAAQQSIDRSADAAPAATPADRDQQRNPAKEAADRSDEGEDAPAEGIAASSPDGRVESDASRTEGEGHDRSASEAVVASQATTPDVASVPAPVGEAVAAASSAIGAATTALDPARIGAAIASAASPAAAALGDAAQRRGQASHGGGASPTLASSAEQVSAPGRDGSDALPNASARGESEGDGERQGPRGDGQQRATVPIVEASVERTSTGQAQASASLTVGEALAAIAERIESSSDSASQPAVERAASGDAAKTGAISQPDAAAREALPAMPTSVTVGAARGADVVTLGAETGRPNPQASADDAEGKTPKLVARGLAALASQKGGSMQIRLDPPSLGDLRIQMTVINGAVSAELRPSSAQAHTLLAADLASLRQALEAQGLSVDRLSVQSPAQPGNGPSSLGQGIGRGEQAHAGHAAAQAGQQAGGHTGGNGQQDGQGDRQQRSGTGHDAGQGQSRGRSDSGGRDDRDTGSRSRRRASFASVFSLRDMS
jgi:flagellar hook-length control protein FliK